MTAAELHEPHVRSRAIVYGFHDRRGDVEAYVLHALRALRAVADRLVVVASGPVTAATRSTLHDVADDVLIAADETDGIWAAREAVRHLGDGIRRFDEVVLTGDSWYGPIVSFDDVLARMAESDADCWGLADRRDPLDESADIHDEDIPDDEVIVRLTPHWLAVRRGLVESRAWTEYWENLPPRPADLHRRREIELGFSSFFEQAGHRAAAAFSVSSFPTSNPMMFAADRLIEDGMPIVSRDVFHGYPLFFAQHAVLGRRVAAAAGTAGYPLDLLWSDLARNLSPKSAHANAGLLEVLPETARTGGLSFGATLAIVQVPLIDGLPDLLGRLSWVPGLTRVALLVNDEQAGRDVAGVWQDALIPGVALDVRVAPHADASRASARISACTDLLRSGEFETVVVLHTARPALTTRNATRYFRRQQVESLLATPGYVANVAGLFDAEPGLGAVFPPTVHIGSSDLGDGWGSHRRRAEEVAVDLGIRVPWDWASPLAPSGGMWIARVAALRRLLDRPAVSVDDLEVQKRLLAYAAGEDGFHVRTVSNSAHASLSHNALEYKLDQMSRGFVGYPAGYIGMLHRAGPIGAARGGDLLRMYLRFRHPRVAGAVQRLSVAPRAALRVIRSAGRHRSREVGR